MQQSDAVDPLPRESLALAVSRAGHRMTDARRAIIDLILTRDGAFDSTDLIADARRRRLGAGRATIFRMLEVLVEVGAIERIDLPSGAHSYVRCLGSRHHHHLVCTRCQRSIDVEDGGIADLVADVARNAGYILEHHRLELFGICPSCQSRSSGK
jgi:Fur family ferric uptake transcriptional regulator